MLLLVPLELCRGQLCFGVRGAESQTPWFGTIPLRHKGYHASPARAEHTQLTDIDQPGHGTDPLGSLYQMYARGRSTSLRAFRGRQPWARRNHLRGARYRTPSIASATTLTVLPPESARRPLVGLVGHEPEWFRGRGHRGGGGAGLDADIRRIGGDILETYWWLIPGKRSRATCQMTRHCDPQSLPSISYP